MDFLPSNIDDLFKQAVEIVCQYDRASASLLQRRLSVGYARAAKLIDELEAAHVIAPSDGTSKPREVLVQDAEEFLKNLPQIDMKPKDQFPVSNNVYKPKIAEFLPEELKNQNDPKKMILGTDKNKEIVEVDFSKIGNLIISGNPISKKYELIESFLLSTLSNFTPKELALIIYDPNYSFLNYKNLPHYLTPIIENWDKAISALRWCMSETDRRFKSKAEGNIEKFPEIYIIYNYDFMDVEREDSLLRLTSMAYRVGIHLIIITDRLNDLPKNLRENIPAKLTFDKFGKNKAIFEFDTKTEIDTYEINKIEKNEYLGLLAK